MHKNNVQGSAAPVITRTTQVLQTVQCHTVYAYNDMYISYAQFLNVFSDVFTVFRQRPTAQLSLLINVSTDQLHRQ